MKEITKKTILLLAFTVLAFVGCKSPERLTIISTTPEFDRNDTWVLVSILGKEVEYSENQEKVTICFDPESHFYGGFSGCNSYGGRFRDRGRGRMTLNDKDEEMSITRMACSEESMKLEFKYLLVLSKCDHYNLGEYSLELLVGDQVVLTFTKGK